jgi:anti-sigma factor RsiW
MRNCDAIESKLTPYVDGELPEADRATLADHLGICDLCRGRAEAERAGRAVLRARQAALARPAPAALRARCLPGGTRSDRRYWVPLSAAATIFLAVGAALLYTVNHRAEALAASLAADHLKCFALADTSAAADPARVAAEWQRARGWSIRVMGGVPAERIRLVGARRCLSTEGQTAHLMYVSQGRPLSVFVWRRAGVGQRDIEILGRKAVIWSSADRMYAVVGTEPGARMDQVAALVRREVR